MAFILVVTDTASFNIPYPLSMFKECKLCGTVQIGESIFSHTGIKLRINRSDVSLTGDLAYSNLTPINGDIMGPFRFFPMECSHGIVSMKHNVRGEIMLNGEKWAFENGVGYIETDSGVSFPEKYTWVHSNDFSGRGDASIMAAVAKIPFMGFYFWGCICVVLVDGKAYRLATYKGVKILRCERNLLILKQGKYKLTVRISAAHKQTAQRLAAPKRGIMSRIIKESPSCTAHFLFTKNGRTIFAGQSLHASYEYCF